MPLSNEIVSEFVKVTRDYIEDKTETTLFGTIVVQNNSKYVRIDGSDLLTPVTLTADVQNNERVTVLIKDHAAIVTGNISSPSARTDDVQEVGNRITNAEILIADKVSAGELEAATAQINEKLVAYEATVASLEADNANINNKLTTQEADIKALETEKLSATEANAKYATIENLKITNADIDTLKMEYGLAKDIDSETGEAIDPNVTTEFLCLTKINTPNEYFMYILTFFYSTKSATANRAQLAIPYNKTGSVYHRFYFNGTWYAWRRHVNEDEIMTKTEVVNKMTALESRVSALEATVKKLTESQSSKE